MLPDAGEDDQYRQPEAYHPPVRSGFWMQNLFRFTTGFRLLMHVLLKQGEH